MKKVHSPKLIDTGSFSMMSCETSRFPNFE